MRLQPANASVPCPCHIFAPTDPASAPPAFNDGTGLTLGIHFKPQADGYITGVRFYKDASMTDAHTGDLWGPDGSLLASGAFTNETASGWQDLTFATPVPVTSGAMYTAAYYTSAGKYTATASYFGSSVSNYPLLAPDSTTVANAGYRGNGVFHSGSEAYPTDTYNSANYWVDVTFRQTLAGEAPSVTAVTPANGGTNVGLGEYVSATFNQNLDAATISSSTVLLRNSQGNNVPATVSYNDTTKVITLVPSSTLTPQTTYTATIVGGSSGVKNLEATGLAASYNWTFTTGSDGCPCSLWGNSKLSGNPHVYTGTGGQTFGVKIRATENGYIQAIRFYKSLIDTSSSHTVTLWTAGGTSLGSGTSTHESDQGWQEIKLSSPVLITQNTDYIISYYSPANTHVYSIDGLSIDITNGVLKEPANSFVYGSGSAFPTTLTTDDKNDNYWIDAVFSLNGTYTPPLSVGATQPKSDSYGVLSSSPVTVQLSNAIDTSTLSNSVTVTDASGHAIAGSLSYSDGNRLISFTPTSPFSASAVYTVTVASSLKDVYGTQLGTPYTFRFTTGSSLATNINQGLGGPVLVITDTHNPYDTYLAEMLRAEGITYFTTKDVAAVSSADLSNYKAVLLGRSSLTTTQVAMFEDWVRAGGNLIAMQPDQQLASFMGLTPTGQTLAEGYVKVDASATPGIGITAETMQYHGTADRYQNSSATTVATLYSNATTTTSNPAVVTKDVGAGRIGAFTYDLPKSTALLHQGNPAWAKQERDGSSPIRPDDLFYGGASTDYLNVTKARIPQADEQQRLLVNMLLSMSKDNSPLPRFWILPHGYKGAVVMAGDDHGTPSGSHDVADELLRNSASNCSVADWECARSGTFIYTASGLTSAQANQIYALGFGVGLHTSTGCSDYASYTDLMNSYTTGLSGFRAKYTGLPDQRTDRTHCYMWSDWDSVPKADIANGMRYNMNYVWWPETWTSSNTGYVTGSGLTMRLTDASGNLLDVYQGVTDLDYENDPTSTTMNTDFDNVIGTAEYYGFLGTHYDYSNDYENQLLVAALAHGLPLISPDQALNWKDALGSSAFSNLSTSSSQLKFDISVAQGGNGMQSMVPASAGNGNIVSVMRNSQPVSYTTSTIKGFAYAIFNALPGSYIIQYGPPVAASTVGPQVPSKAVPATGASGSFASITAAAAEPSSQPAPSSLQNSLPATHRRAASGPAGQTPAGANTVLIIAAYTAGAITVVAGGTGAVLGFKFHKFKLPRFKF